MCRKTDGSEEDTTPDVGEDPDFVSAVRRLLPSPVEAAVPTLCSRSEAANALGPKSPGSPPIDQDPAAQRPQGIDAPVLSTALAGCITAASQRGWRRCAEYLLALPARLRLQHLTCGTMDALLASQAGRRCHVTALLAHMMTPAEGDADAALRLIMALLRSARLDTLSGFCRAMVEAKCGAKTAFLLLEAIRSNHNHVKRLAELLLHMIREQHMAAIVHLLTIMLAQKADDDIALVLKHMLGSGGVPETGALGAALVDAGAALLVCNAELALTRCSEPWPQDATCRTLCGAVLSIGRADASAHIIALLLDRGHPVTVLDTLTEMEAPESSKAVSHVLLRLADQQRIDVLADIVASLVQRQRVCVVLACARLCSGRRGWMAAGLLLELSHKQKFLEITKIMEVTAVDGMMSDMAQWIGILIRGGHARAWADIAAALHCRNRYWIVADIMEALIPRGSVAVEAQTVIWSHLGAPLCADFHISLVDRGKFEQACQLCAAAVLNKQTMLVLEVVMAFIQDRGRADIVARKMVYLMEKGRADLAAQLNDALVNDRRFKESAKLAAALSSMLPVLPLLDCLRGAGARVVPEVWHEHTASCMLGGFPMPAYAWNAPASYRD